MCSEKKGKKKRKERKSQCSARVSFSFFFFSAFLAVICLTSAAKWSRETEIPLANPALSASAGLRGACDEGSRDSVPARDSSSWEGRKRAPKKKHTHTKKSKQTDSDFIYIISCRSATCRLAVAENEMRRVILPIHFIETLPSGSEARKRVGPGMRSHV